MLSPSLIGSRSETSNLPSGKPAKPAWIFRPLLLQALGGCRADGLYSFRSEPKQGGNIPYFVELRIALHIEGLDIASDHPRQDRFADIHDFLRSPPADRAVADQMGVDVAATGALNGVALQIFSDEKGLHLSQLQGPQDAPKTGNAPTVAARMAECLVDQIATALVLPLLDNLLRVAADFVSRCARQIGMEPPDQRLTYIRMELRLEQRAVGVLAGQNPILENTLLHQLFQVFGDVLEMLAHFIFDTALSMAALVSAETIASSPAGQRMEEVLAFGKLAKPKIEDAGAMSVQKNNGEKR